MAIDTAAKRASVSEIIFPDGTVHQADRQTLSAVYGGLLAAAATYDINFVALGLSGSLTWNAANSRYEGTIAGIQAALVAEVGNVIPVDVDKT